MSYDWSKFTRKIYIKTAVAEVFEAWVKPNGITTWFIANAIYTSPNGKQRDDDESPQGGDDYYWKWHQDLESRGKVIEVVPNKLFSFTFGKKHQGSTEDVVVTVEFGEKNGESWYMLTQNNMGGSLDDKAQYHLSCNMGWSFFMTNMKAVLEHGIDLRETDTDRAYETRAVSL